MHNYQSSYLMAPEVSNEFNLLNEFLNSSLLDDGGLLSGDLDQGTTKTQNEMLPGYGLNQNSLLPPSALPAGAMPPPADSDQNAPSRTASTATPTNPEDKKRREAAEFYLQVADPSGNDMPEKRMERVLLSKYEAGLLRPFNYIQGYKRLMDYLESHIHASSKQKILAQINRFRPKFREKVQQLTDIQLVYVEMWFERTLMEYDRVFASMAVPACCWRRTGEIFRGNKEMAELIGVQVEDLRDVCVPFEWITAAECGWLTFFLHRAKLRCTRSSQRRRWCDIGRSSARLRLTHHMIPFSRRASSSPRSTMASRRPSPRRSNAASR